jgi:hypothetical protein
MKIHTDFITNSSSSSFVIMSKEPVDKAILKEKLIEAIGGEPSKDTLIPDLGEKIANALVYDLTYTDINGYLEEYCPGGISKLAASEWKQNKIIYKYYKEYPYIMFGSVVDDSDDPMEVMLVDMDIAFKNNQIIVLKDGGY